MAWWKDKSSYQTTFIGEGAVAAHKNITSNCLPENLYPKNISNHLLGFLHRKAVHERRGKSFLTDVLRQYKETDVQSLLMLTSTKMLETIVTQTQYNDVIPKSSILPPMTSIIECCN